MKQKIGVISLFTGCGGLDLGFTSQKYDHISTIDVDQDSVDTLRANSQFEECTIRLLDIKDMNLNIFRDDRDAFQGPSVVIGGAPCQPFSKNGYWVSNKRRKIGADPRNLLDSFVDVVATSNPEGFLFENVESIMHPTNRKTYEVFIEQMESLKYDIRQFKVNAQDYGCPQKRKRIFVVGTRGTYKSKEPLKTHAPIETAEELGKIPYVSVGEVISKFEADKYFEPQEDTSKGKWSRELRRVPPGGNYLFLTEKRGNPKPVFEYGTKFWNFLLKLDPSKPSWTIAATPGPWVGPFHWTSRRLRVPEIAAIQSFPEEYKFIGNRRSIQKQIGNAVPSDLSRAFADFLYESIE